MLKIYNTLTRTTEDFKSLKPKEVSIYVCGPTVYDLLHVGNFRGPVFFNFVRNWLENLGYKVNYALNFTDVEDKILNRATKENKLPSEVSELYIEEYQKDFFSLGLKKHEHNPKVTQFIPEIIKMIDSLVSQNTAYAVNGDVNYSIDAFKEYGKLSGRKPEELKEGVRIDVNENKKNPLDFALWKSAKPNEPMSWDSPWGKGRPGWHIECSAMIKGIFGDQIDIHGGGLDLMFPHHENEIAQTEGCTHKQFASYWMHWNMINFGGAKMSKSLGNIVSLRDFLKDNHPEIYKWMMLSVHYRSTADFTQENIDRAVTGLAKFYSSMAMAQNVLNSVGDTALENDSKYEAELAQAWSLISEALNDDFGTPAAFAVVYEVIRKFNSRIRRGMKTNALVLGQCQQFLDFMKKFGGFFSLFQENPETFLTELDNQLLKKLGHSRADIDSLVTERSKVREAKDFAKADEYRKKLTDMSISVSDTPQGSFWEVTK